jgi:hypothetical protein
MGLVQPRRAVRYLAFAVFVPVLLLVALRVTEQMLSALSPLHRAALMILGAVALGLLLFRVLLPGLWTGIASHIIYDGLKLAASVPARFLRWLIRTLQRWGES